MLSALIRSLSHETAPLPTGVEPRLAPPLHGIRAMLFDIYGTVVTSASGDIGISSADDRESQMRRALEDEEASKVPGPEARLSEDFFNLIREDHAASKARGIDTPEVDIRNIWSRLLEVHGIGVAEIESLAVRFECLVNPVWPMPELEAFLTRLKNSDLALGVISNAQFFTPLLFPALIGNELGHFGFDEKLCFWSWMLGVAKPSQGLFKMAAKALKARDIAPEETLFIGNDMRNDIAPAAESGFKTALFAGDKRSLRMREEDGHVMPTPDIVVTELGQLFTALSR